MTESIRLRPLRIDDAEAMSAVLADPSLYEFTGGEPPSPDALARQYAVQTRGRSADGTELCARAARLLADDLVAQGVERLVAHIHPQHTASHRVAARLGMSPTPTVVDGEVRWEGRP